MALFSTGDRLNMIHKPWWGWNTKKVAHKPMIARHNIRLFYEAYKFFNTKLWSQIPWPWAWEDADT